MKHPFRIRAQKSSKDATDAQIDAVLGDDFGLRKRQPLRAPAVKQNRTGGAQVLQDRKFLKKIQDAARAAEEKQQKVQSQDVDPWAGQGGAAKPVEKSAYEKGCVLSSTHSAFSYNPEKTILEKAQRQVAQEYLKQQMAAVSRKLLRSRESTFKELREASMRAFEELAGRHVEPTQDLEIKAVQEAARKELAELESLRAQLESKPSSQIEIDFLVSEQQKMEKKKADLTVELQELGRFFDEERAKLDQFIAQNPSLNGDRLRADAFESSFLSILEEMALIRQLLSVYGVKTTIFNDKVLDYPLQLDGEIASTLRQTKAKTALEELFLKMKRDGKFDEENEEIKSNKILRVKTSVKLFRGAMDKYKALSE